MCLLLLAATVAGGCALGGRTFGQYVDDHSIAAKVKMRLAGVRAATIKNVNVDVYDGTVYLSGSVQTEEEKSHAEIAAWKIGGVEQVINDLRVAHAAGAAPSNGNASPASTAATAPGPRASSLPAAVRRQALELPGVARLEPDSRSDGPPAAWLYDRDGVLVATIYAMPMVELGQLGFHGGSAPARPIHHVTILPVASEGDLPDPQYLIVLWHVSHGETPRARGPAP